jgi:cobalt-zinc-cadmium efflux system protein
MAVAAALTGVFLIAEVVGGILSGSLALLADAGHMVSDFASLVLAWLGFRIATRPADLTRTYGFRRFAVLAAFVNGLSLFGIGVWILIEAAFRLFEPSSVLAGPMLWIAIAGLVVNIIAFFVLHGGDRENLNMRGAIAHVIGDLLGSVAAIIASVIILTTGWTAADPILSALIALILFKSAWGLVKDSGHVLLEGAPASIDVTAITQDLSEHVEGVLDVHHAHAWSLDGRKALMTMHARIAEDASGPDVVSRIKARLMRKHGVDHATIEIERETCLDGNCT